MVLLVIVLTPDSVLTSLFTMTLSILLTFLNLFFGENIVKDLLNFEQECKAEYEVDLKVVVFINS